jgi:hypothetical protein
MKRFGTSIGLSLLFLAGGLLIGWFVPNPWNQIARVKSEPTMDLQTPALAKVVAQGKTVLVGWFTAAKGAAKVQFSFSSDAGATFGTPITVEGQGIIGRVEVALLDEQTGIAAWMETTKTGTFLMAARIDSSGKMGKRWEIGAMDSGRKSGFPQLEVLGENVYFAWTEVKGETNQLRTVFLPKAAF